MNATTTHICPSCKVEMDYEKFTTDGAGRPYPAGWACPECDHFEADESFDRNTGRFIPDED